MTKGKGCQIQIKPQIEYGLWETTGFTFNKDSTVIIPKRIGKCKIEYVVNDIILASRIICVK